MDLQLEGKRVLITGASKGIGLAAALAFAREGASPTLVGRDPAALRAAADVSAQTGMPAACVALDLGRADAPQELLRQAGPVDILVNNAGAVPGAHWIRWTTNAGSRAGN